MYNLTKQNPFVFAIAATLITAIVGGLSYLMFEPSSLSAASDTRAFIVSQEIGAEISFASNATGTVAMSGGGGAIGGETGGTRTGSTTVSITTNNSSGYTLGIKFASANGMEHPTSVDFIDYYATSSQADYTMGLGVNLSGFAYSASSSNVVSRFQNNGTACEGAGTTKSIANCFYMQADPTTDYTIVDSSSSASSEDTIVGFKVIVAPSSGLDNGFYYATTTLTATTQ